MNASAHVHTNNHLSQGVVVSIFRSQATRLGFLRVAVGGGLMYMTVPLFIFLHTSVSLIFYRILLRPFLDVPRLQMSDYIILDRYNMQRLNWFDRINCLFCEYANGVTLLMNHELDHVASYRGEFRLVVAVLATLYLIPQTILLLFGMLLSTIPANILMNILGLHRGSHKIISANLEKRTYAAHHAPLVRQFIRLYKVSADVIAYNLEQIESAWCPIKHLERIGQALPRHHKHFYAREDLKAMCEQLETKGTVSSNPPKHIS